MGFSRQEHWNKLPCSPPGDLPNTRVELISVTSPALTGRFLTTSTTWEAPRGAIDPCKKPLHFLTLQEFLNILSNILKMNAAAAAAAAAAK